MTRKCILATSQLNQWVLDYEGNRDRIIEAIDRIQAPRDQTNREERIIRAGYAHTTTSPPDLSLTAF